MMTFQPSFPMGAISSIFAIQTSLRTAASTSALSMPSPESKTRKDCWRRNSAQATFLLLTLAPASCFSSATGSVRFLPSMGIRP